MTKVDLRFYFKKSNLDAQHPCVYCENPFTLGQEWYKIKQKLHDKKAEIGSDRETGSVTSCLKSDDNDDELLTSRLDHLNLCGIRRVRKLKLNLPGKDKDTQIVQNIISSAAGEINGNRPFSDPFDYVI